MINELDLEEYVCHKKVFAGKILEIRPGEYPRLCVQTAHGTAEVFTTGAWLAKHTPEVGGYYVVYKDDYRSFSPAEAFEVGYALADAQPVNAPTF